MGLGCDLSEHSWLSLVLITRIQGYEAGVQVPVMVMETKEPMVGFWS